MNIGDEEERMERNGEERRGGKKLAEDWESNGGKTLHVLEGSCFAFIV